MLKPEKWEWTNTPLVHVVDGDTLDFLLVVDIGFWRSVSGIQRVRLNRIDAYAIGTDKGNLAAQAVTDSIGMLLVTVTTIKPYKFGWEAMAEVTLPDGSNISDLMVANGHALPWDGKGPRPAKLEMT